MFNKEKFIAFVALLFVILSGSGCSQKERLSGLRESVLLINGDVKISPDVAKQKIVFNNAVKNSSWPHIGGSSYVSGVATYSFDAKGNILWTKDIVTDRFSFLRNTKTYVAQPVVADGMVFVLGVNGVVQARDVKTGELKWERSIISRDESGEEIIGGGITYHNDYLYICSPLAELICLDSNDGSVVWRYSAHSPLRSVAAVSNGKVVANSIDGMTICLDVDDGSLQWTHAATSENTIVFGGSVPAIKNDIVVIAYASGEVFALNLQNGRPLWSGLVESPDVSVRAVSVNHVRARPLILDDVVIVMGYGGITKAFNMNNGREIWSLDIGGHHVMSAYGNYVFALANENMLICFTRDKGLVKWIRSIDYTYGYDKSRVSWSAPLLAGGDLYLSGDNEELLRVNADNGEIIDQIKLKHPSITTPAIADGVMYIVTSDGKLISIN